VTLCSGCIQNLLPPGSHTSKMPAGAGTRGTLAHSRPAGRTGTRRRGAASRARRPRPGRPLRRPRSRGRLACPSSSQGVMVWRRPDEWQEAASHEERQVQALEVSVDTGAEMVDVAILEPVTGGGTGRRESSVVSGRRSGWRSPKISVMGFAPSGHSTGSCRRDHRGKSGSSDSRRRPCPRETNNNR
jgi:hypothetical protein